MTSSDSRRAGLRTAGVAALYGEPTGGYDVVPAPPPVAEILAAVHRRVVGTFATVIGGDAVIMGPQRTAPPILTDDVIDTVRDAARAIVLAGPGVVTDGAVPGLHALAAAGRFGVLNTWGAKGVFDWRSRHHLATAGLQALDFELGGLPESDLVIATGIDPDEAPADRWSSTPSVTVDPTMLDSLSEHVTRRGDWRPVPELRTRLTTVTQDGWADEDAPAAPSAITRNYGTALGTGGRVAADAGRAGFWVARTFSTTELGTAHVPGRATPGFAAAAALVTRLAQPHRPVLAVVDALTDETQSIMELANRLDHGFAVEVWSDDGDELAPEAHLERLRPLAVVERCAVVTLATAPWQLDHIIDAAGPVIAWGAPAWGGRA